MTSLLYSIKIHRMLLAMLFNSCMHSQVNFFPLTQKYSKWLTHAFVAGCAIFSLPVLLSGHSKSQVATALEFKSNTIIHTTVSHFSIIMLSSKKNLFFSATISFRRLINYKFSDSPDAPMVQVIFMIRIYS